MTNGALRATLLGLIATLLTGQIRPVCVAGAKNLVVQSLREERPPFRLLPTWNR